MENASKALVMAGGVLISIIIISMLMLVINNLTNYQEANTTMSQADAVAKFNNEYIPYNRQDVRGNELITLGNKVIDHNEMRTSETSGNEGYDVGYAPITLEIDLNSGKSKNGQNLDQKILAADYTAGNQLFKNSNQKYVASATTNSLKDIYESVKGFCSTYPLITEEMYDQMATGITKIFYTNTDDYDDDIKLQKAVDNFNLIYGKVLLKYDTNSEKNNSKNVLKGNNKLRIPVTTTQIELRKNVFKYYEFQQFKRARFECTDFETDSNGRVIKMVFKFTGDIS